ncbi:chloride channel protein [Butyrivibrio sp. NC2002]|uniref:chloride channel protein n=1 Tax=Butyrivibrio sp. NC2002 TaxID=1410610 RepID=UPI000AE72260|nr:chloride channel protein [Butyrivibrio sp. NC2002]
MKKEGTVMEDNKSLEPHYKHQIKRLRSTFKWLFLGIIVGLIVGAVGAAFFHGIKYATAFRKSHSFMIWLLPFAGLLIVFLYRLSKEYVDTGTNLVITTISAGDHLPKRKIPLIFVATILTHLCGGSAGRESAALQLGGSIGHNIGEMIKLDEDDCKIITMCGMSAAFAALFGTPMAAAFLAMEIESIGVMYYAALIPCVVSALVASNLAKYLGTVPDVFAVTIVPNFTIDNAIKGAILAVLCALISIMFCIVMKKSGELYKKAFKNPYIRIFVGGCLVVLLTLLVGNNYYNGAGMDVIELATEGKAPYEAFFFKMVFTAVTMGAGFKGGEIIPALYIGATFGCLYSQIFGFNSALCSAIGMGALFCGITNCPISSLLLCFEMFGYNGMPYYLLAIALSYTFSGYYGVYDSQKIMYSKFRNKYINTTTK